MNYFLLFVIILLVISETPLSSSSPALYEICRNQFGCGDVVAGFPFWGGEQRPRECGHPGLQLHCKRLKTAREDYKFGICPQNITLDTTLFVIAEGYENLTLSYHCPHPHFTENFGCSLNGVNSSEVCIPPPKFPCPQGCSVSATVMVPKPLPTGEDMWEAIEEALSSGFEVEWRVDDKGYCQKCIASEGKCGINPSNGTVCYCQEPSSSEQECLLLPHDGTKKLNITPIIGLAVPLTTTAAIAFIVLLFKLKRKPLSSLKSLNFHLTRKNRERVEAFILQYGSLAPKRFSYSNIKKMTNSFKDKLGQGGYGSVYKGELPDGRIVAIKVLSKSKGDGQDFINEVASISRTSHVNIVTLLGYCYESSKRALIYEFLPNGSLDKFIYNQGSPENHQLAIKTLYEIALGIALGLEYLHRGCTTRILHFDIKPQNILLDANFCPKISDFGLAKLCETRDSVVSMTGARGTCGYIAPEVFCRNFGGVSYKSDVYSYGMMVLEMIGGRRNVNVEASHTSEIYFPSWLYKQLENSEKLNLDRIIDDEEEETTRKMIVASLWCIQTIPSNRPSMSKVLEMLQGSLEALPLPPEPLLSSPAAISLQNSNTTSSVIMQVVPSTVETNSQLDDDDVSSNT
ncbi:hypothetical protein SLEP1_g27354 [Rubroshorea leprosula]|uniref:non-specific serine/threonine protein kinase n=1 Tax=Rubroshorea leprosula TaxID=152421 RepID=A0AAV5JX85_9ROSI|nr:hypothetical protein SLEP1_g27354 [Rubroshorea leprosula]